MELGIILFLEIGRNRLFFRVYDFYSYEEINIYFFLLFYYNFVSSDKLI